MEKNTKQMLQLVNQILDFRKIQNGKMRLHVSLFNLNEMVDSFEKEFRVMAEENEVSFTFQLAGEDIMVWADKEKVAIVIRNIISNAFKFTPAGGNIYVTMGVSDDDKHCYVRVEDSLSLIHICIFYSIDVRTGLVNRYVLSEIKGAISNLLVTPAGYVYLSVAGQGTYEYLSLIHIFGKFRIVLTLSVVLWNLCLV